MIPATKQERKKILKEIENLHLDLIKGEQNEEVTKSYIEKSLQEVGNLLNKKERSKSFSDRVVSYGEVMSSFVISQFMKDSGIWAKQVISTKLIVTDDNFINAEFLPKETKIKVRKELMPLLQKNIVPVVTGFIGATEKGEVTTLGRGGSDYSAAIIGHCLNAREVQIWTDVDGIFSADPRTVKNAKQLTRITYKEASELAAFGAKILHPRTIRPLIPENIPIVIKNTFNPNSKGTYINGKSSGKPRISAIASKPKVTLINLYSPDMLLSRGFLERIFAVFAKYNICVDLVSVSEVSVSVTLDNEENLIQALNELKLFTTTSKFQVGVVSIIGESILENEGILKNVFTILNSEKIPVRMISLGASDINISIVTDPDFVSPAVNVLHDGVIFKDKERKVS